jgi:hypothetical protein
MPPLEVKSGAAKPTFHSTSMQVIAKGASIRPNAVYYITKCIVPSLQRVLGLAGADVEQWCVMVSTLFQFVVTVFSVIGGWKLRATRGQDLAPVLHW